MAFLILDPYFFIYPFGEQEPLDRKKVAKFVFTLNKWAEHLNRNDHELGISEACIEMLNRHPRSILNGKFLSEVSQTIGTTFGQINQVLVTLFSTLRDKLAFAAAMRTIPDALYFEIKQTTIAPADFVTRLPQGFDTAFLQMLGELTFARAQKFYPIAAFKEVDFVTAHPISDLAPDEQRLLTCVHFEYVLGSDVDPQQRLDSPIEDEYAVLTDPSSIAVTQSMTPRRTLRDAVESAVRLCGSDVVISRELEIQLSRNNDVTPNGDKIERVIRLLGTIWLPEYRARRKQHYTQHNAYTNATREFRRYAPHEISDESQTVHTNPRLRDQRLVRYGEHYVETFLHVKISPRIYFGVLTTDAGRDVIVLGHIGHLDTARY